MACFLQALVQASEYRRLKAKVTQPRLDIADSAKAKACAFADLRRSIPFGVQDVD
jgi:hypothetical protein